MSGGARLDDFSKEPCPRWRRPSVSRVVRVTRLEDDSKLEQHYRLGDVVGKGAFGVVYLATPARTSGEEFAIKVVTKSEAGTHGVQMMENELTILKKVVHPHIVSLKEVFETSQKTMMVMEYCGVGDLETELARRKRFSLEDTKTIINRLTSAVSYMHDNGMVHRDLKLENILLKETDGDRLNIKVTDFGLSCMVGSGPSPDSLMQSYCGTPLYMAPEVLCSIRNYTKQCDVWSMGVIMYFLISGVAPFRAPTRAELCIQIEKAKVSLSAPFWDRVEGGAKRLLLSMLEKSPAKRISAKEVLNHPWITGRTGEYTGNVLQMMSEMGESLRISAAQEAKEDAAPAAAAAEASPGKGVKAEDDEESRKKSKSSLHPLKASKSKSSSSLAPPPNGEAARPPSGRKPGASASASTLPSYMMPTRSSAHTTASTKQRLSQGQRPSPSKKT